MLPENNSKTIADNLIEWLREYAFLQIDSLQVDEQAGFPAHVFLDLGNQGFFGLHISRKYGGLELKTYDILRVIEQVAAIDLTLALIIVESIQGAHTIENFATDAMKNLYLYQMARGRIFTAGAMTEAEAGSNPRAMKSVATPDKSQGWLLRGTKRWVGMGAVANVIAIYVQQLDSNDHWQGMSGFLVPQGIKGLKIKTESATMGICGIAKNMIVMDDIRVSAEHLLGKKGEGMEIAQNNMMYVRLCLAGAMIGAMKRCIQLMFRFAERRMIATGLLLDNPVTLVRLSEMTAVVDAIDNFVYLIASSYDENAATVPEEAFVLSKILGSEYLSWMVDLLVQLLGVRGYDEANGVSKLYRDSRAFRILEGPTEALNMYLGSRMLENNVIFERFLVKTLNQKQLFSDIKLTVDRVNQYCLTHKSTLFTKPFAVNYWVQALVGEIISYGFLLASINYRLEGSNDLNLKRAQIWAKSKYDYVVQQSLTLSLQEQLVVQASQLRDTVAIYADRIGYIEQSKHSNSLWIESLLKSNHDLDLGSKSLELKHKLCSSILCNLKGEHANHSLSHMVGGENLLPHVHQIKKEKTFPDLCVHQLFEQQAELHPDACAVVYKNARLSYAELNRQADKVAHYLQDEGIKEDKVVAIYFERSIELIVSILGVLKSGGAYLPLDYNYPEKNLKFMFEDSGVDIILSQRHLAADLPFDAKKILFLEDILEQDLLNNNNPLQPVSTASLAYVMYTSGSTGHPKGVMLPHKALSNLIYWHQDQIHDKRSVLQFTTINFDMSFIEIFSAFGSGGTLVLISEQDRLDLISFAKTIKEQRVEQIVVSVPYLKSLAEAHLGKEYFSSLKEVIVAGEQLIITPAILLFFNQLPSCRLLNYYGPSETHVVTGYTFPIDTSEWPDYAPIGQVIDNAKVILLDEDRQPVPVGATGEIYIGGVSLARGYINRSELTQEKFTLDPWGSSDTERLYRSGDFAKYLSDGNLMFLGRKDEQVKIRGFRIEPQEIELQLSKYPGIKEAVVIAKKSVFLDKHLEAFIVTDTDINERFIDDVYLFLQERLPPYMLPSKFNILPHMPLTTTGKINRNALEDYESTVTYSIDGIVAPATETEKLIITVMEDIFKLNIGTNSSFISVGGNSLLAMHIVSILQAKFGVEIPAYSILSDPTIADTAKRIDALIAMVAV